MGIVCNQQRIDKMKTTICLIFLVTFIATTNAMARKKRAVNKFDQPVNFSCPKDHYLSEITSSHSNHHEDRIFSFKCAKFSGGFSVNYWSQPANVYDGKMDFQCPNTFAITGTRSNHHNHYEDRIYRFRCSQLATGNKKRHCFWSQKTCYDDTWTIPHIPGYFITGVRSEHHNHYEDRRFSFQRCRYH